MSVVELFPQSSTRTIPVDDIATRANGILYLAAVVMENLPDRDEKERRQRDSVIFAALSVWADDSLTGEDLEDRWLKLVESVNDEANYDTGYLTRNEVDVEESAREYVARDLGIKGRHSRNKLEALRVLLYGDNHL